MSDLDEKLEAILDVFIVPGERFNQPALENLHQEQGNPYSGEVITVTTSREIVRKAIKQAFIDAGWINTKNVEFQGFRVKNLMTGQEWYDRFRKSYVAKSSHTRRMPMHLSPKQ